MLLPRRTLNAIVAVLDIAIHARAGPVAAKALADRHGLGPRHLEPVLQALVRTGLLKGVRGPRGGYELARERRRLSVGDIVRATGRGSDPEGAAASDLVSGVLEPALQGAAGTYLAALDQITVEDLCVRAGSAPDHRRATDFTI